MSRLARGCLGSLGMTGVDVHGAGISAYDRRLPRKRMAAGVLFFDSAGRVLLVDPAYREPWEIPGGAVEREESPRAGARREVREELGLQGHRCSGCRQAALVVASLSEAQEPRTASRPWCPRGRRTPPAARPCAAR
ncbi:NUDIX domain-containing protein [Streptomyces pactum]|uniref:NUDIX domain-containing protein n=1 Tax=Streptomyces pactum TaxID=68249 RepID=UPI0036FFBC56